MQLKLHHEVANVGANPALKPTRQRRAAYLIRYMSTQPLAQYETIKKGIKKIAVKQLSIIAESLASTI